MQLKSRSSSLEYFLATFFFSLKPRSESERHRSTILSCLSRSYCDFFSRKSSFVGSRDLLESDLTVIGLFFLNLNFKSRFFIQFQPDGRFPPRFLPSWAARISLSVSDIIDDLLMTLCGAATFARRLSWQTCARIPGNVRFFYESHYWQI